MTQDMPRTLRWDDATEQWVPMQPRRSSGWRTVFLIVQVLLAGLLGLAFLADVSVTMGVFLATVSVAVSGVYLALRP